MKVYVVVYQLRDEWALVMSCHSTERRAEKAIERYRAEGTNPENPGTNAYVIQKSTLAR
jgi:hypothetical protein